MPQETTPALSAGSVVQVVKWSPAGTEVTRYPATVLPGALPGDWFAVAARWTMKRVESHGLVFNPGDTLVELFSPSSWFDVFHVYRPDGRHGGWYANVTYPTIFREIDGVPTVIWHDLYLDIICPAGGEPVVCDEDELAESGLEEIHPELHRTIVETCAAMLADARAGRFPFVPGPLPPLP